MRRFAGVLAASVQPAATSVSTAYGRGEGQMHTRIAQAIRDLDDPIHMEDARNSFGGHKAAALDASCAAVRELRASRAFRAQRNGRCSLQSQCLRRLHAESQGGIDRTSSRNGWPSYIVRPVHRADN
jgi:hypothetical protein